MELMVGSPGAVPGAVWLFLLLHKAVLAAGVRAVAVFQTARMEQQIPEVVGAGLVELQAKQQAMAVPA